MTNLELAIFTYDVIVKSGDAKIISHNSTTASIMRKSSRLHQPDDSMDDGAFKPSAMKRTPETKQTKENRPRNEIEDSANTGGRKGT